MLKNKQSTDRVFCFSKRDLSSTGYFLIHQLSPNNITPALKGLKTLVLPLTVIKKSIFSGTLKGKLDAKRL